MADLRRHQLHRLSPDGWREVAARPWDDEARDCLAFWSRHDLPLVVTRQGCTPPDRVALGLPSPARFGRRRLAIGVVRGAMRPHAGFPRLADLGRVVAAAVLPACIELDLRLGAIGCPALVYGSHGWQALTGLDHVRAESDLDLLLPVDDAATADAVCRVLARCDASMPRIDGELLFTDGAAVAWREWTMRHRHAERGLLVKRTDAARIEPVTPC